MDNKQKNIIENSITSDSKIEELGLSLVCLSALKKIPSFNKIKDICASPIELLKQNLTPQSYSQLRYKMHSFGFLLTGEREKYNSIKERLKLGKEVHFDELEMGSGWKNIIAKIILCNHQYLLKHYKLNQTNHMFRMEHEDKLKDTFNFLDIILLDSHSPLFDKWNLSTKGIFFDELAFTIHQLGLKFADEIINPTEDIPDYIDMYTKFIEQKKLEEKKAEEEKKAKEEKQKEDNIINLNKQMINKTSENNEIRKRIQKKEELLKNFLQLIAERDSLLDYEKELDEKILRVLENLHTSNFCKKLKKTD